MAKLLTETHLSELGKYGYKKTNTSGNHDNYEGPNEHSVIVYKNGSWAHFHKGIVKNSVSNKDTGVLLGSYLKKLHQ